MGQYIRILKSVTIASLFFSNSVSAGPSAESLLKSADRSRGGAELGLEWKVEVTDVENGEESTTVYLVKSQEKDALVEVVSPPRKKGEVMLFNDRTIWYLKKGLRKPISLSARQKLSGQAANGDIASTNYARDYSGEVSGSEKVSGKDTHVLMLDSVSDGTTYDKIRYWVSKDSQLGLQAEFLTKGGQVFKKAQFEYSNSIQVKGKSIPFVSQIRIVDSKNAGNYSVLKYSEPKVVKHAPSVFNINSVKR